MNKKKKQKQKPVHIDQSNPGPMLTTKQYEKYYPDKKGNADDDNNS